MRHLSDVCLLSQLFRRVARSKQTGSGSRVGRLSRPSLRSADDARCVGRASCAVHVVLRVLFVKTIRDFAVVRGTRNMARV